jgi:hypothetical protein
VPIEDLDPVDLRAVFELNALAPLGRSSHLVLGAHEYPIAFGKLTVELHPAGA